MWSCKDQEFHSDSDRGEMEEEEAGEMEEEEAGEMEEKDYIRDMTE